VATALGRGPRSSFPTLSGYVSLLAVFEDAETGHPWAVAGSLGGDIAVLDLTERRPIGSVLRVGPG
jgi:hypothetical protein